MRILLFCNKLPYPAKDGSSIAIHNMIRGYYEAGGTVTVLALNTSKHYYPPHKIPEDDVLNKVTLHTIRLDTQINFKGAFQNLFTGNPYHASRFLATSVKAKLKSILSHQEFDVVQIEKIYMGPYLSLIRQYSSAGIVLRAHNVEHHLWESITEQTKNPVKKAYLRLQTKRLRAFEYRYLKQFDALLPISVPDGKTFQRMGFRGPVLSLPMGLPLADYLPTANGQSRANGKQVFHLGAMDWMPNEYGVKWFLEAVWPSVIQAVPEACLALAGRQMNASFRNVPAYNVTVYGEVEDAKAFMQDGDIMVVPIWSGSGLRIKMLEGMALGKAIVSTSMGAKGIKASEGEDFLVADDAETFSSRLITCLRNPDYHKRIGENARNTVAKTYDLPKIAEKAMHFLENMRVVKATDEKKANRKRN